MIRPATVLTLTAAALGCGSASESSSCEGTPPIRISIGAPTPAVAPPPSTTASDIARRPSTISTGPGTTPVFDWSPGCAVTSVWVYDRPSAGLINTLWMVEGPGPTNVILPPVVYGVVPDGADQVAGPVALTEGAATTVELRYFTGGGQAAGTVTLDFRP